MSRCRNCGILDHKTQHCPRYGPWYPEPGKTRADYAKLDEEIGVKVAGDILAEHEGHDHDGEDHVTPVSRGGRPRKLARQLNAREEVALARHCEWCLAPKGQWCTTMAGREAELLHRVRYQEDPYGHVQSVDGAAPGRGAETAGAEADDSPAGGEPVL